MSRRINFLNTIQEKLHGWGLDAGDVRQIKFGIQRGIGRLLLLLSTIAYAAMAGRIAGRDEHDHGEHPQPTLAIRHSAQHRRDARTTRAIGLAEAVLMGLVGILLGLAAGFEMAGDAWVSWGLFFGFSPRMVVPWDTVAIGVCVVMGVSILASLWPAIYVARSQPLSLLQAGRAAV